ncbi:MAG: amidase [Haliscomenobacteraceae bacterium CHB4]|nr:6-aminohexanoate-cyclic-dimer hydrolase [Saprospiraceae bacterium]MCE7925720.1 amidase [Haliscomenobacteraceae bacterium CHB4]
MNFEEYRRHDALGLAELVKKGEIKAEELLEIAIRRTEDVNPTLNVVIHKIYDEALATAKKVSRSGTFAGVPFLVKDLGMEVKGTPMRAGCRGYSNYISTDDSYVVQKMRQAGLVIFGKTNTPEFGLTPFTEPELFGPTRNPWNLERTPAGSSGGSAAAVAAGIVPMASANDGGGSIRMPASACGLFGIKPSRGRTSWGRLFGEMWNGAVAEGCVSRSVRDSAAYLDAIIGTAPGDPYDIQRPKRPYLYEAGTMPEKLHIGYTAAHTLNLPVDPVCQRALEYAVEILRSEGHAMEEVELPYKKEDLTDAFLIVVAGEIAGELRTLGDFLGRKARPGDVEPNTYALHLLGKSYSAADYAYATRKWNEVCRRIADFHTRHDLLLTPTLAQRPFKTGALQNTPAENRLITVVNALGLGSVVRSQVDPLVEKIYNWMPWTAFANITGQPSMSVPLYWTESADDHLPIGVMLTARLGEEDTLFRLAGQLEKAAPWWEKVPKG